MVNPTLYDVLGVAPDASRDEIKKAWRESADRFEPGQGGSTAQFRLFNEAAEVLLDPERRKAYDEDLPAREPTTSPAAPASGPPVAGPPVPGAAKATSVAAGATAVLEADEADRADEQASSEPVALEKAGQSEGAATGTAAEDGRRIPLVLLVVLALVAALAVGGAAYLGFQKHRAEAYQESLDRAPSAAERAAVAILSYDYESLEADRDAAAKFLTPEYRSDYVDTFDKLVQGNATETKAKVQAQVLASSAMVQTEDRDAGRIPVLLFVNQTTVSTAHSGEPQTALNRVKLDMVDVDGTWLVDSITSY